MPLSKQLWDWIRSSISAPALLSCPFISEGLIKRNALLADFLVQTLSPSRTRQTNTASYTEKQIDHSISGLPLTPEDSTSENRLIEWWVTNVTVTRFEPIQDLRFSSRIISQFSPVSPSKFGALPGDKMRLTGWLTHWLTQSLTHSITSNSHPISIANHFRTSFDFT